MLKNIYRTEEGKFDWRINLPVLSREIYQVGGDFTDVHEVSEPVLFLRGSESGYIFDEDILALVSDESVSHENEEYSFVSLSQRSETGERPQASIVFTANGQEVHGASDRNGPVDASLKAIEAHVNSVGGDGVVLRQCHQWFHRKPRRNHYALAKQWARG